MIFFFLKYSAFLLRKTISPKVVVLYKSMSQIVYLFFNLNSTCFNAVFIVLVNAKEFRTLMYNANLLGMAEGDYVFIIIQLAEVDWWGSYKSFLKGNFQIHLYTASVNMFRNK